MGMNYLEVSKDGFITVYPALDEPTGNVHG